MSRKWFVRVSVLAAVCLLAPFPALADNLNGDTIHVNYLYPSISDIFIGFHDKTVTASGASFDIFGHDTFTVFPTIITLTNDDNLEHLFTGASFNGFSVVDVTSPGTITAVTIDPLTNLAGFGPSRIRFIGTTLFVNFQDLTSLPTTYVQLDLTTTTANTTTTITPEPASMILMATALAGMTLLLRRRKRAEQ